MAIEKKDKGEREYSSYKISYRSLHLNWFLKLNIAIGVFFGVYEMDIPECWTAVNAKHEIVYSFWELLVFLYGYSMVSRVVSAPQEIWRMIGWGEERKHYNFSIFHFILFNFYFCLALCGVFNSTMYIVYNHI